MLCDCCIVYQNQSQFFSSVGACPPTLASEFSLQPCSLQSELLDIGSQMAVNLAATTMSNGCGSGSLHLRSKMGGWELESLHLGSQTTIRLVVTRMCGGWGAGEHVECFFETSFGIDYPPLQSVWPPCFLASYMCPQRLQTCYLLSLSGAACGHRTPSSLLVHGSLGVAATLSA